MPFARKSALLCAAALTLSAACSGNFDTSRVRTEPVASLGDEIFTVLCDRVGASVLTEDLTGASYHRVCHRSPTGKYSDTVDETRLPPADGNAAIHRKLAIAKLHAMARRRTDLIKALNATFEEETLPVPFGKPGETIGSHKALSTFLKRMVPLYETNPIDQQGSGATEALMPSVTRATGRLFAALGGPDKDNPYTTFADQKAADAAQLALAALSGRQGYRPTRVVLGALRPAMTYPGLRSLTQTFAPRLAPGGPMRDAFQNVLGMTQSELDSSVPQPVPGGLELVGPAQLNRPRTNTEIAQAIMLATNPAFAAPGAEPRFLVVRDVRGNAVPNGNQPGKIGTVAGPFVDQPADGFADVDPFGRFVTAIPINTPFFAPIIPDVAQRDPFGRAVDGSGQPLYTYLNTSEALVSSLSRDLEPLLDPDPAAERETLADLLAGAFPLYGGPIQQPADWGAGGSYPSFDTQSSPIVDLLHATGWMLAHKNSDLHLKMVKKLFAEHPQLMARVIGASLRIRDIANQYPEIALDPSVTLWDEMGEFTAKLTKNPPLFRDLLRSLAHPDVQAYIGSAYSKYNQYKDELHYDTNNVNGPPINETAGGTLDPQTPVDPQKPDAGAERSEFHRILQIIHDVNDVNACNKQGAKVRLKALGLPITYPFGAGYEECELFVFKNMGVFYLHSILGKAKLEIRPDFLNSMMSVAGIFTDPNKMMEESAEIVGMTLSPTPPALNRLVYFGAESPKFDGFFGGVMPDRDPNWNTKNDTTNKFISRIVDPVSSAACPERPVVDPNGTLGTLWLADCNPSLAWKHNANLKGDVKDLMRIRNHGTIFTWEKFEFYKAMRPLLKAFDDHGQAELFLEQIEILYRHWATPQHAPEECNKSGDFSKRPWQKYLTDADRAIHAVNPAYNPKWCNESGASRYEPILVQAFVTDFLPALGELVKLLDDPNFVIHERAGNVPYSGLDVLLETTIALFDPDYATSVGMMDRNGSKQTSWSNGLIQKPVTLFDLFANAMKKIDERHAQDPPRRDRWRRARSRLVDQFLAVSGEGQGAQFRNPAFIASIPVLLDVLREQLNANCPDRETSPMSCVWATKELAKKSGETLGGPAFSTVMHLLELINQDEEARRALETHLKYLLEQASDGDALHSTLTSMSDMMQIIGDDEKMPLIYNAIAIAAAPENPKPGQQIAPGTADRVLELMHALTLEQGAPNPYDPYRVLDRMLVNLFSPIDPADPHSQTPIEIFLDTIAEVNRHDADAPPDQPLAGADFRFIFATMRDFMTNQTRGMEQFYEIVRHRDGN
jgi:hypothetical protein